jgi:hypothetical protein
LYRKLNGNQENHFGLGQFREPLILEQDPVACPYPCPAIVAGLLISKD